MIISTAILSTFVLLFFLLPGLIFTRSFWGSERGYLLSHNFYQLLLRGLLTSTLLYLLFYDFYNFCAERSFLNDFDFASFANSIQSLSHINPPKIDSLFPAALAVVQYAIFLDFIAYFGGWILRGLIMRLRIDILIPRLRYKNDWYYLLSGRGKAKNVATIVDFLCEINGDVVLYKGTVLDYGFKADTLEYISLTSVRRTAIKVWESEEKSYSSIDNAKVTITGKIDDNKDLSYLAEIPKAHLTATWLKPNDPTVQVTPKFYNPTSSIMIFKFSEIKNININYSSKLPNTV